MLKSGTYFGKCDTTDCSRSYQVTTKVDDGYLCECFNHNLARILEEAGR